MSCLLSSCYYDNAAKLYPPKSLGICDTSKVSFASTIAPIIDQNCNNCHGKNVYQSLGSGYNLDGYANIVPYASPDGLLIQSITFDPKTSPMPKGGSKLPDCQIAQITKWINAGAPNN
jgi:mono/diheme cytochrome c family protein